MTTFKVIIAGSRSFNDYDLLKQKCDKFLSQKTNIEIVSGTANGADKLGERYARERGYILKQFPADWNKYGKGAGYIRNGEMSDYGEALIVFWDGKSRGTEHMIKTAKSSGLKVRIVRF